MRYSAGRLECQRRYGLKMKLWELSVYGTHGNGALGEIGLKHKKSECKTESGGGSNDKLREKNLQDIKKSRGGRETQDNVVSRRPRQWRLKEGVVNKI